MADRRAVLIPGRGYDTRYPLFAYTGEALRRTGFDVHEITWAAPERFAPDRDGPAAAVGWVVGQVEQALG